MWLHRSILLCDHDQASVGLSLEPLVAAHSCPLLLKLSAEHLPNYACPPGRAAATKLLWLKRREPENWERLAHVLLPHDYVNFWLTGRLCMEVSGGGWGAGWMGLGWGAVWGLVSAVWATRCMACMLLAPPSFSRVRAV